MELKIVILAAGQGKRMRSALPKVLHCIADKPLLEHVYDTAKELSSDISIVYGHGGRQVLERLQYLNTQWIEQPVPKGTGHAVMQAAPYLGETGYVMVLCGDVPLLRAITLQRMFDMTLQENGVLTLLTTRLDNPYGYGRIIRNGEGDITGIVEEKDATAEQKLIDEINTGILVVKAKTLQQWLQRLDNNNVQQEYYLTDIVAMAVKDGYVVQGVNVDDFSETQGINNKIQLAALERIYQQRNALHLMEMGVTLRDPARLDVRGQIVNVGLDVELDINVVLEGRINFGSNVKIGANSYLRNVEIGDDVVILPNSVIEDAKIGTGCRIGPFARVRPGTTLRDDVHIGNFVEIKNSQIGGRTKINHLSYIGDSQVGEDVNIGAGTITCNYDGANKYRTVIEDGAFIGSNTQLVAPVTIGKNATIGAGSTITRDAPDGTLTLSRAKQLSMPGWQRPAKQPKEK